MQVSYVRNISIGINIILLAYFCAIPEKNIKNRISCTSYPKIYIEKGIPAEIYAFSVHAVDEEETQKYIKQQNNQIKDSIYRYKNRPSEEFLILKPALINCTDIDYIADEYSEHIENHVLIIQLSETGTEKLKKLSENQKNKRIAIVVNREIIASVRIKNVITDGKLKMTSLYEKYSCQVIDEIIQGLGNCWR